MAKRTLSMSSLLDRLFPKSGKAISEKLSTEEFNEFTNEASALSGADDDDDETVEEATEQSAAVDTTNVPEAVIPAAETAEIDTLKASLATLTGQVETEKKATATAQKRADDLQVRMTEKDAYIAKLKASVNPLADEDASSADASESYLTDTDREAIKLSGGK